MNRKAILVALGVVSSAALMAVSTPSYSDGPRSEDLATSQQGWTGPENGPIAAESDVESILGVAGRRADDMADVGPAGPGQGFEHRYDSDVFIGE